MISVCALAFVSRLSTDAEAQLVRVSPGPLAEPHKKWDGAGDCFKCHQKRGKKLECFGCHQHEPLKKAIAAGRGLHAKLRQPCKTCHLEHKGRGHRLADWSKLGGRAGFRHQRTGFSLAGMHDKVKCKKCHDRKTPSGRTSFPGLSAKCNSCHEKPHDLPDAKLRDNCTLCHVVGGKSSRRMRGKDVPFDHAANTGTKLVGRHAEALCVDCHQNGKMSISGKRRTCKGCHEDPHGKTYTKWKCADCHSPKRSYRNVRFNHRATDFSLAKRHKRVACKKCHQRKNVKPKTECDSCHSDKHRGRFDDMRCSQCHPNGSWKASRFEHARLTKFPLTGRHRKESCRSCHRGKKPAKFEKHETTTCQNCHAHRKQHRGQFKDRSCSDCHPKTGSRKLAFDHDEDTEFPLTGKHAPLARKSKCKSCHKRGRYKTGKTACVDCHEDSHKGQMGSGCESCHSPDVGFAEVEFDHDRQTKFPIEGLHKKLDCGKCHPGKESKRVFKLGKRACVDCHEKDEPHRGKLGRKCESCHRVEKGAPKFAHDTMTSFPLTGKHAATACSHCHRAPPSGGPAKPGWTAGMRPRAVNRQFPVMGQECGDCHADRHGGRYGSKCQSCHETTSFANVSATIHDTGSFALRGEHNRIACAECHQTGRMLSGLGEQCQTCHWEDDRHNNALGPACGDCHRQLDWQRTKFSHLQTGFALRGAHRTARCESCHGVGTYQGTPTDCETCHLRDAQTVTDPIHTAELQPCDRCHREVGFVPARSDHQSFRLVGQHRFVRCRNCHGGGVYSGTPAECEDCHITKYYDPRNEPDHRSEGFATSCADCHSSAGWRPATNR